MLHYVRRCTLQYRAQFAFLSDVGKLSGARGKPEMPRNVFLYTREAELQHNDGFSACLPQKFCKSVVIYQYLIMHLETGVTESSSEQNFAPSFSLRVTLASL